MVEDLNLSVEELNAWRPDIFMKIARIDRPKHIDSNIQQ